MLVLSRKCGEEIVIGDDIQVIVLELKKDRVRLGITAPVSCPIHRREVYEQIKSEEQISARPIPPASSSKGSEEPLCQ